MNYTNTNQNISIYFKEIRNFSSLNRQDEVTLFTRISRGDKSAETEIFNRMAKLAVNIAKTYTSKADLLEDLIQEANLGILAAIKKFDLSTGFRFSSYARFWMKCYIGKYLDEMGVVNHSNANLIKMANKIREKFYKENQREISEYELMDALEEQGQVVNDVTAITNITSVRIDAPLGEDEDGLSNADYGEFADRTASENGMVKDMEEENLSDQVKNLLKRLTPRERTLVELRFFSGDNEMDYATITEKWNKGKVEKEQLTQERVRQLILGALKKMK
jgi:RNA polymerase primary sigma factor